MARDERKHQEADIRKQIATRAERLIGLGHLLAEAIASPGELSSVDTLRTVIEVLEDNMNVLDHLEDDLNELCDDVPPIDATAPQPTLVPA